MPERQLVPHSDKRSQRTSSLANRFQSIAPSQRIGLFNSERIRCAYRAATTATNYDGKTLVVNGTGNGGTSQQLLSPSTGERRHRLVFFYAGELSLCCEGQQVSHTHEEAGRS